MARIAGLCYLLVIATGLFAEVFVRQALRVPGDAIATAQNIKASAMLYRWGYVADLFNFIIGLPGILIMYVLFKPVNNYFIKLAMFFVLIQTAVIAVNLLNQFSPLLLLSNAPYLAPLQPNQLAALALHSLNLQAVGYATGLVFFGFYCIIIGCLIVKSSIIPKLIGVLYAIAGLSYLANSFILLLSKDFSNPWFTYIALPAFIGELSLCLWLLVKGVKEQDAVRS